MALFMDMHAIDGPVAIDDVAKAHAADLQTQDAYGVHYLRYWVDRGRGVSAAAVFDMLSRHLLGRPRARQDLLPGRCARCRCGSRGTPGGARACRRRDLPSR
jgi:hypothetical protein